MLNWAEILPTRPEIYSSQTVNFGTTKNKNTFEDAIEIPNNWRILDQPRPNFIANITVSFGDLTIPVDTMTYSFSVGIKVGFCVHGRQLKIKLGLCVAASIFNTGLIRLPTQNYAYPSSVHNDWESMQRFIKIILSALNANISFWKLLSNVYKSTALI